MRLWVWSLLLFTPLWDLNFNLCWMLECICPPCVHIVQLLLTFNVQDTFADRLETPMPWEVKPYVHCYVKHHNTYCTHTHSHLCNFCRCLRLKEDILTVNQSLIFIRCTDTVVMTAHSGTLRHWQVFRILESSHCRKDQ